MSESLYKILSVIGAMGTFAWLGFEIIKYYLHHKEKNNQDFKFNISWIKQIYNLERNIIVEVVIKCNFIPDEDKINKDGLILMNNKKMLVTPFLYGFSKNPKRYKVLCLNDTGELTTFDYDLRDKQFCKDQRLDACYHFLLKKPLKKNQKFILRFYSKKSLKEFKLKIPALIKKQLHVNEHEEIFDYDSVPY